MTDCPNGDVRDLLPDLLHDRLALEERDAVRAHVDGCASCREELALLESLRASMHRVPAVSVGSIVAALPAPLAVRTPRRFGRAVWSAAAALLVAVGGTSLLVQDRSDGAPPEAIATRTPSSAGQGVSGSAGASVQPDPIPTGELVVASGAVSDLSDRELTSLLGDLETLDVLPSAEVETVPAELVPAAGRGGE